MPSCPDMPDVPLGHYRPCAQIDNRARFMLIAVVSTNVMPISAGTAVAVSERQGLGCD
jgi:hypothetical protein